MFNVTMGIGYPSIYCCIGIICDLIFKSILCDNAVITICCLIFSLYDA